MEKKPDHSLVMQAPKISSFTEIQEMCYQTKNMLQSVNK